jgi:transposase
MKQILKTYKFRLYPNEEQEILINKTFGCTRYIYNQMLSERKNVYENLKNNKEELKKYKYQTEKEFKQELNWLKEVDYDYYIKDNIFCDIDLDPIYEAKCIPYLQEQDLLWIIGHR